MELNRKRSNCNAWKIRELNGGPGRSRTADTRIFRDRVHPTLSVLIGLNLSEFHRLAPFPTPPFSPSNHIATNSSEKVWRKQPASDRFAPTVARLPAQGLLMIVSFGTDQKATPGVRSVGLYSLHGQSTRPFCVPRFLIGGRIATTSGIPPGSRVQNPDRRGNAQ
jgi:hypothetical protein